MTVELKPCPFCGEEISYHIMDSEGNMRDESYLQDAWSGLSYSIKHYYTEENKCPIASDEEAIVGCILYGSLKTLAKTWNMRSIDTAI